MANFAVEITNVDDEPGFAGDKGRTLNELARIAVGLAGGAQTKAGTLTVRGTLVKASGTATCAAVAAADALTVNNIAVTAAALNARGTAIFASIVADNVLTINGVAFTAKATPAVGSRTEFALGANDTAAVDNAVALINLHPQLIPVVTAVADTAGANKTVKLRAVSAGTGGNAITLTRTGSPITVSGATLANGAAASGNQFDTGDTNAQCATALAAAINASATAGLAGVVTASAAAAVVTVSAAQGGLMGNAITLVTSNGTRLAVSAARLAGGTESRLSFSY